MAASNSPPWRLRLRHGGAGAEVAVAPTATVAELRALVASRLTLEEGTMKLTFKGANRRVTDAAAAVAETGLRDGAKVMVIGNTAQDLSDLKANEARSLRRERTRAKARRAQRKDTRAAPARERASPFGFQRYEALPGFTAPQPTSEDALGLLRRLGSDRGIQAIVDKHGWVVGVLKEFAPSLETGIVGVSNQCLLGYNENKGQAIALRLRTDDFEGFRHYRIIIKTLLHELAHMVHSEHDANFYALDRQLNKEYQSMDWTKSAGHTTGSPGAVFRDVGDDGSDSEFDYSVEGSGQSLGGASQPGASRPAAMAAQAALLRLSEEEQLLSGACGGISHHHHDHHDHPDHHDHEPPSPSVSGEEGMDTSEDAEAARRLEVMNNAAAAEAAVFSYEYRPRRSVRVGPEYQADIPSLEADAPAASPSPALPAPPSLDAGEPEGTAADAVEQQDQETPAAAAEVVLGAGFVLELPEDELSFLDESTRAKTTALTTALQQCLVQAGSKVRASACLSVLALLLGNIVDNPAVDKFKQVRLGNTKFHRDVGQFPAALAFLKEIGFQSTDGAAATGDPRLVYSRNDIGLVWLGKGVVVRARAQVEALA